MQSLDEKRFIVEEKEGYTPVVGRLLSMMEYARRTTLEEIEDFTAEELDYRIDGKGNSIGCLLYHIACVEDVYQIITFEDRDPNETDLARLETGLALGEKTHQEIHGNEPPFYIDKLKRARKKTLELFKQKDDRWLDEVSPFGPDYKANHYFRWFHVFEDELNHRGQIRLIRRHLKSEQEEQF
ncbi:DinB family protein [Halobacillus sp. Marseille-Q1614]|uniref:DinB family protein n=1 Tax=Halobacillus sp. Marseille-Q1614 TaxID=2709134 RepID=UPI0020C38309|nr:DinB family protein [Halobacillus sp. Marseille-Q1614]